MEKSQEELFNKLKAHFDFTKGGNGSYRAKKDNVTITIHTNGKIQFQGGGNKKQIEQEINEILKNTYE